MSMHDMVTDGSTTTSPITFKSVEIEAPVVNEMRANGLPKQIATQSLHSNGFKSTSISRLHISADMDLPKILQERNISAETWSTPLEMVRLSARSIALFGSGVCMNIGPRFDESGIANIKITTFDRHLYPYFGPTRNFTPAENTVFADVWALLTSRGLTSLKHPPGVDESHLLTYEQWCKTVISSLISRDHVRYPGGYELTDLRGNLSTLDYLHRMARKEEAVEQAEFKYWRAVMNPNSEDEELQQAEQRYVCVLKD
ncbi:hypothetical protein LTR37_021196 [Vermiconidia calcicola]|uniref:Uncharacterized protein n=1 Tax=Vermiconidia calcicola TaxID=1690605 RepID=A0ACC3MAK6_9PEZI|nr:hypothetical protein LTR37_021196 [Vermiconidia calcicola]